ncbi:MAG TPA: PAS domain-containing protein, partial [Thermoanaerobaculia bacterium]|nr:PAS domain-containing protein [Thermoanaerobaculia bacterium]
MTMRTRLLGALFTVLIFIALNIGVHVWGDRARTASLAELQHGIERQLLVSQIEKRFSQAHQEISLLAGVLAGQGPDPVSADARAAFAARLEQIGARLQRAQEIPASGSRTDDRFATVWRDLRASWLRAYESFGVDNERAITELSLRSDPLSTEIGARLLPRWEREERQRARATSLELSRVSDLTERVEMLFFVLSALIVILVAFSVSRFMVDVNKNLEVRVGERTRELETEVQERRKAEAALRESEARYILAAQGANDGLWDWDLESNEIYLSPRWKEMLGYGASDLSNSPHEWFERVHPEDLPKLQE